MSSKDEFLYPRYRFHGEFDPAAVVFDANLQEFAQKVTYLCSLENSGKLSQQEAYKEIKSLWKQVRQSKRELGIGQPPAQRDASEDESDA